MNRDLWPQAKEWLADLEGLAPDEQRAYLERRCADAAVCDELIDMLACPANVSAIVGGAALLPPGTMVGPYKIMAPLGAGGMGQVYRGHDPRLGRDVAIKMLPVETSGDTAAAARLAREARAVAALNHPNICAIYDVGEEAGRPYLVMELLEGEGLDARLTRGPFPAAECVDHAIALAAAIEAAHAAGVMHRDLKPSNIFLTSLGRLKIIDFGLAKEIPGAARALSPNEPVTASGVRLGTPQYMAPEQAYGEPVDARADLFSLGAVLYEMATGRSAFGRSPEPGRRDPLPSVTAINPAMPPALDAVIEKALAADASERYETSADMAADLVRVRASIPGSAGRRRRSLWIAAAAAVAVTVVGLAVQSRSSPRPVGFKDRDWVLITAFENRTGDPALDGAVEAALTYELMESRYVNVVPRTRVDDALRLMRLPVETRVDVSIGREVSVRDGAVRLLLAGQVDRSGGSLIVRVRAIDPRTRADVAVLQQDASSARDLPAAVRTLSSRLRTGLGESESGGASDDRRLQSVTTVSTEALKIFSAARIAADRGQWAQAEAMFAAALAEDPHFASAHLWLGWSRVNLRRPKEQYLPEGERAVELIQGTSERERYFILSSYYRWTGQEDAARGQLEALVARYPDDYWGLNNLAGAYSRTGRLDASLELVRRLADGWPTDFRAVSEAASRLTINRGFAAARPYFVRAEQLLRALPLDGSREGSRTYIHLYPFHELWLQRQIRRASAFLEEAGPPAQKLNDDLGLLLRGSVWATLGRLQQAQQVWSLITDANDRALALAHLELLRGNNDRVAAILRNYRGNNSIAAASVLVRAHRLSEAERMLPHVRATPQLPPNQAIWAAQEIELARGNRRALTEARAAGAPWIEAVGGIRVFTYSETLASALLDDGDVVSAIRVLEKASTLRENLYIPASHNGYYWLRIRALLADAYRRNGDAAAAGAIKEELRVYLEVAEPNHPLLREPELRRRRAALK